MANRLPQFTLTLLLVVAACVVLGGAVLARRTETMRIPRDRAPLRDFASVVEEQTQRLERLYEGHLQRIADAVDPRNAAPSRSACKRIIGIRQLSVLHGENDRAADQHIIAMKSPTGERWSEPTLRGRQSGLPRAVILLAAGELLDDHAERKGWIDQPAQPLLYWQRRDLENVAIVFSIDREEVAAAIDDWFRSWMASGASGAFAGVAAAGGPDRVLGSKAMIIGAAGSEPPQPERPDFLLPIRARFGTWQLASWDRWETRTSYHAPTLVVASVLGVFTALLGFAVFAQQRRASALAMERVSFVNRVSHELRTPLTNILLNIDLAADASDEAPRETNRRLALVQEEARRLGRLIDNVLTFSRHERGKLRAEPRACVPAGVIGAVIEQFAPSFARRGLEVRCTGDLSRPCLLDADALAQILANLLSNVEKYVPGGLIEIVGSIENATLSMVVKDEGPGVPREAVERIFCPFERLDRRVNEGATGTGLGLAIARDLAASMGGTLRLVPSPRGAAFQLCVPAPDAPRLECLVDDEPKAMSGEVSFKLGRVRKRTLGVGTDAPNSSAR